MPNLLLTICYDGSAFHGWQIQKNAVTVQEVFQNALKKVFEAQPAIHGCSRTDSGVHANEYCINFHTEQSITDENIIRALNTYLPREIAVTACRRVPDGFHARYSCVSKEYVYKLYNGQIRNPFLSNYAYHYRYPVDEALLNQAAQAFVGRHDFSGFCSVGSKITDTVRNVKSFSVSREGDMVLFRVCADGFLYNMVRIMVGTLLFVAQGRITLEELPGVIASKERKRAGKTAPPQGLYLNHVNYEEGDLLG